MDKTCPFCLSDDTLVFGSQEHPNCFAVLCKTCEAEGPEGESETHALELWNRRGENCQEAKMRAALVRLGSMEAFVVSRVLTPRDDELKARIDFARKAITS